MMPIGRFIICVIVAFILYGVLYMGTMMGVFAESYAVHADLMRAEDDPLAAYAMLAHLVQTIAIVWLFDKAVGSNDVKAGAVFGLWTGIYLGATDSTVYFGLNISTEPWLLSMVIHLVSGAIVGAVLALLYKGKETSEA